MGGHKDPGDGMIYNVRVCECDSPPIQTRGQALPPHVVNHGVLPQNDLRK